jgi:hypothetical protein
MNLLIILLFLCTTSYAQDLHHDIANAFNSHKTLLDLVSNKDFSSPLFNDLKLFIHEERIENQKIPTATVLGGEIYFASNGLKLRLRDQNEMTVKWKDHEASFKTTTPLSEMRDKLKSWDAPSTTSFVRFIISDAYAAKWSPVLNMLLPLMFSASVIANSMTPGDDQKFLNRAQILEKRCHEIEINTPDKLDRSTILSSQSQQLVLKEKHCKLPVPEKKTIYKKACESIKNADACYQSLVILIDSMHASDRSSGKEIKDRRLKDAALIKAMGQ